MKVFANKGFTVTRIKKGMSITQLAEKLDMTRQALSQIELRKHGISPERAKLACEILDAEFDDLFDLMDRA